MLNFNLSKYLSKYFSLLSLDFLFQVFPLLVISFCTGFLTLGIIGYIKYNMLLEMSIEIFISIIITTILIFYFVFKEFKKKNINQEYIDISDRFSIDNLKKISKIKFSNNKTIQKNIYLSQKINLLILLGKPYIKKEKNYHLEKNDFKQIEEIIYNEIHHKNNNIDIKIEKSCLKNPLNLIKRIKISFKSFILYHKYIIKNRKKYSLFFYQMIFFYLFISILPIYNYFENNNMTIELMIYNILFLLFFNFFYYYYFIHQTIYDVTNQFKNKKLNKNNIYPLNKDLIILETHNDKIYARIFYNQNKEFFLYGNIEKKLNNICNSF